MTTSNYGFFAYMRKFQGGIDGTIFVDFTYVQSIPINTKKYRTIGENYFS